jgi:hypothetical protein
VALPYSAIALAEMAPWFSTAAEPRTEVARTPVAVPP